MAADIHITDYIRRWRLRRHLGQAALGAAGAVAPDATAATADDLMRLPHAEGIGAALRAPQGERRSGHGRSRDRVAREAPDSLAASAPLLGRDSPRSLGPGDVALV